MGSEHQGRKLHLFLRHRADLIDYATPIVGDRMLAEDVVQDAWLRFSEAGRWDAGARFILRPVGYLYRIVRNLAVDVARRQGRERWSGDAGLAEHRDPSPSVDLAIEARDKLATFERALSDLPERERRAFEMHRIDGETYARIGAELGVSQTRAYELVRAALAHCMTRLIEEGHV